MKRSGISRNVAIVCLIAFLAVAATGTYFVSSAWSDYTKAKSDERSSRSNIDTAQSQLTGAQSLLRTAESNYATWYRCWINSSYYWDWLCGNESTMLSAVNSATTLVSSAEQELSNAQAELGHAQDRVDQTSKAANSTSTIWGVIGGVALIATIVTGIKALRVRSRNHRAAEAEAGPDWDCVACNTHNEGGMFCIECGHSKEDSITESAEVDSVADADADADEPLDAPPEPTAEVEETK